jgi:hypothetical protein
MHSRDAGDHQWLRRNTVIAILESFFEIAVGTILKETRGKFPKTEIRSQVNG